MRRTDWAYLAAIIDGEGHTCMANSVQPRVQVVMSTEQPVLWIYETFGGVYRKKWHGARGISPAGYRYRWGYYSHEGVYLILEGCLPYLKLKRRKAKEVMSKCRYPTRNYPSTDGVRTNTGTD